MIKKDTNTIDNVSVFVVKGATFTLFDVTTNKHATFTTSWYDGDLKDVIPVRAKTKGNSFHKIGTLAPEGARFLPFSSIKGKFECQIFTLFWNGLKTGMMPTNIQLWHQGKCENCGRPLTDPASLVLGIGPGCKEKEV